MKNIIRILRTEKGWSQAELADRLDVPLAFAIARLFGRGIEDIFDDGLEATEAAE